MRLTLKDITYLVLLVIFLLISVYGIIQGGRIGPGLMILAGISILGGLVRRIKQRKSVEEKTTN